MCFYKATNGFSFDDNNGLMLLTFTNEIYFFCGQREREREKVC